MKQLFKVVISIGMLVLLMGCGVGCYNSGCSSCDTGCGYYDYPSQCGAYSCTDNDAINDFSNPCPGPYQCDVDP